MRNSILFHRCKMLSLELYGSQVGFSWKWNVRTFSRSETQTLGLPKAKTLCFALYQDAKTHCASPLPRLCLGLNCTFSTSSESYRQRVGPFETKAVKVDSGALAPVEAPAGSDANTENSQTLMQLCQGMAPDWLMERARDLGYVVPTDTQREGLPLGFAREDFILHAQTGSGKTLVFLLPLLAAIDGKRAAVQAIVVVPTRELGMQVARVARQLAGRGEEGSEDEGGRQKGRITVMALLDGGTSSRQKAWLKAEPPQLIVGTPDRILRMVETKNLRLNTVHSLVVDEVDAVMENSKYSGSGSLRKLLSALPPPAKRQTIFSSATVPQHRHFLQECAKNKWIKASAVHCHVEPEESIPLFISHRYAVCNPNEKLETLHQLIQADQPRAAIIFVNEQSEKSKRAGTPVPADIVADFLAAKAAEPAGRPGEGSTGGGLAASSLEDTADHDLDGQMVPLVLLEEANVNSRTFTVQDFRDGHRKLLVATEIAARGLDLPEVSHVYNFDLPAHVVSYVHRAGRSGRRPIEEERGVVTTLVTDKELFALKRIENELRVGMTIVGNF